MHVSWLRAGRPEPSEGRSLSCARRRVPGPVAGRAQAETPHLPVRNIYHKLPGPAPACPPPAGQAPQFPHPCCPPLLCPSARRRVPGPVAGRAQAETPHLPSTECLSQASRASTRLSAARRASTTVSTPQPCAPAVRKDLRRKDFSRDQSFIFLRPINRKSSNLQ